MINLSSRFRFLAASLSFLAGFIDALGFIHLGGYFVSFMSGNSTRMAVGLASYPSDALVPAMLIILFLAGVVGGTMFRLRASHPCGNRLLIGISALLGVAACLASLGLARLSIIAMPIAMGAMNTVFQRDGEVSVGVTYMTGTLVKAGQRIAAALSGGDPWAWIPHLLLWLGLILGAVCGAAIYPYFGLNALWLPAVALFALSFMPDLARQGR